MVVPIWIEPRGGIPIVVVVVALVVVVVPWLLWLRCWWWCRGSIVGGLGLLLWLRWWWRWCGGIVVDGLGLLLWWWWRCVVPPHLLLVLICVDVLKLIVLAREETFVLTVPTIFFVYGL